ncbi:hypothetical protein ESP57_17675 [Agromyces fucosus]|uniref:M23ase beta-sheet core domain-containing protein n=1 Tax=Agromyces fucosus TaxID=41985 RepID=A0A4Q2JLF1_9MICO|nr:cell wall-binding repeat-containing protein [Agromyces fucosus]RXZ46698.1 hypothetical protein ESP57_17675 [Agromyces fucosus]
MRRTQRRWAVAIAAAVIIGFGSSPAWAGEVVGPQGDPPATTEPLPTSGAPSPEEPDEETPAPEEPSPGDASPAPVAPTPTPTDEPESSTPAPAAPDDAPQALSPFALTSVTPFGPGVHRLAGADRFSTSVAISQRFASNVPVVYVATGADFPDALSAAAPAAHLGGPLLLTHSDSLPAVVRDEVVRLAPDRIVVVGGEAVIGAGVYDELAMLAPTIIRLGGADRYESGELLIADSFTAAAEAFIATGNNFPDALAASAAAGSLGAPVFLVDGESVRPSTIAALYELGVRTIRIAGGSSAVSVEIAQQLTGGGFTVLRHEGADRYLTAVAINAAVFGASAPVSAAFIANGDGFADALAGAALAGAVGGPLYVAQKWCVPQSVSTAIGALAPTARVLLGGPAALSDSVARDAVCAAWMKPASGRITDVFGPREPICTAGGCTQSFHRGVDLGTGCNAPIYAAAGGRVVSAGWLGTYGNWVKIDHGAYTHTGYAHIANGGILVSVGEWVLPGQQIAWSGATGAATGCHLHFEVYENGTQVDPVPFMLDRGIRLG